MGIDCERMVERIPEWKACPPTILEHKVGGQEKLSEFGLIHTPVLLGRFMPFDWHASFRGVSP